MKSFKLFGVSTLLFISMAYLTSQAQTNYEDVVYLKNGSIIRGVVVEQVPNQSIKIKTREENLFFYKIDEIEKMTKEPLNKVTHSREGIRRGVVLLSASSNALYALTVPDDGGSTYTYFEINSNVGYFIVKNLALGLKVGYTKDGADSNTTFGAFGRYYIEGKVFTELGVLSTSNEGAGAIYPYMQLGYAAFLTKNIAFEPKFTYLRHDGINAFGISLGFSLFLNRNIH